MARSRTLLIPLTLLGLFLLGTVVVLSSVSYYLAIDATAYLTETEIPPTATSGNSSLEQIPRIIHQTWKTDILPARWKAVSKTCTTLMPDYEYMLWTDASSREFIAKEYSWFLDTFDSYTYPIQRADAIRYFVLYHYGGVYLDLDVGCRRRLDPLLVYDVVLPKTIPVGVSNDLMFAAKGHPFMAQTIHNLITFDHNWILNYPTVMFSTGPMFLSAQYGFWTNSHPVSSAHSPGGEVRILSKPLYGKNAKPDEAPNAFFSHHYGSSWHADDAAFITFLGKWGRFLMKIGGIVLAFGVVHVLWFKRKGRGALRRPFSSRGRYDIFLPRNWDRSGSGSDEDDEPAIRLGTFSFGPSSTSPSSPTSTTPLSSSPPSPTLPAGHVSLLPLPFDLRPSSPALSTASGVSERAERSAATLTDAFRRAGTWAVSVPSLLTGSRSHARGRSSSGNAASRAHRSFVAFLPAIFTPAPSRSSGPVSLESAMDSDTTLLRPARPHRGRRASASRASSSSTPSHSAPRSSSMQRSKADEAGYEAPPPVEPRPATPLTVMDLLDGGSDVRTSRSASISIAEGMPPPYRAGSARGTTGLFSTPSSSSSSSASAPEP